MIVYVSIGNSDDKLTQREWSMFCLAVDEALSLTPKHGVWFSAQGLSVSKCVLVL
jgi:hypothetical protein